MNFSRILESCPVLSERTRYWFIRTEGGSLYQDFIGSNRVEFGYGKVSVAEVPLVAAESELNALRKIIQTRYPELAHPGLAASQLFRFCRQIKKGDVVLIPSSSTLKIAIGFIDDSEASEFEIPTNSEGESTKKSRSVRWLKSVNRSALNAKIISLLLSHQTIVEATDFAQWIDPELYKLFRKGDSIHFVMELSKHGHINAGKLFGTCSDLLLLAKEFCRENDIPDDSDEIDTRINLNSPGTIEWIAVGSLAVAFIGVIGVVLAGGKFKAKLPKGATVDLQTPGILDKLNDFLNQKHRREMVTKLSARMTDLEIQSSDDVVDVIVKASKGQDAETKKIPAKRRLKK